MIHTPLRVLDKLTLVLLPAPRNTTQKIEKICYVAVMSARKLQHYFEAHRVRVLTNQPLNDNFKNQNSLGRMGKWAMELSENIVDFKKRSAIKSQVLADFIVDWIEPSSYTEGIVVDTP
jgi:hypothetical protein